MQKAHDSSYNNYWRNYPNVTTPIVQDQLNRNETTVDTIDDRVVAMDTTKANQTDLLTCLANVTFDEDTGIFTFYRKNGTTFELDTDLEKVVTNFDFDNNPSSPHYQQLILYLTDGTVKYIDLSAFITNTEFVATDTIQPQVNGGVVRMNVINGSITAEKIQPNYLADVTLQAQASAQSATASEDSATLSRSWAEGGTGTRPDEDRQNSKYYADLAEETVAELLGAFGVSVIGQRLVFGSTFEELYDIEVQNTVLIISERS